MPPLRRSALLLVVAAMMVPSMTRPAFAQSADDVASARRLFGEALKDEQNKRFDVALDKFERVQHVKDTVNVRYRIGTCLEGMGRVAAALKAYQSAIDLGQDQKTEAEVVRASTDRISALDREVARVTLTLSDQTPADAEVRVDDEKVDRQSLAQPILLDPGHHTISAHATGAQDFHTSLTLSEGGSVSLSIPLDPVLQTNPRPGGSPDGVTQPGTAGATNAGATAPDTGSQGARSPDRRILGYALLAGGGVLVLGSVVTFVLRHNAISSLETSCPGGTCPPGSDSSSLDSTHSRAQFEGPLAVGLGVAGVLALGAGAYFVAFAPRGHSAASPTTLGFAPALSSRAASFAVEGTF